RVVVSFDPPPAGRIEPPQNLRVNASQLNTSNSTTPDPPAQNEAGSDSPQLLGFNIYRVVEPDENQPMPTAEDIVGNPDNLVGSLPSTSTTFTDIVSTSKGNNFLYSATSFYGTGTTSRGSEPAGTQLP